MTPRQRATYLAVWAIGAATAVYLAWGWVSAPVGCPADCEFARRAATVFVAVFAPIFAGINVPPEEVRRDR